MAVQVEANLPKLFAVIAPFIFDSKILQKLISGHRSSSSKPFEAMLKANVTIAQSVT